MAPKARFGGFLVAFEVLMLEIDDPWVNIDDHVILNSSSWAFGPPTKHEKFMSALALNLEL